MVSTHIDMSAYSSALVRYVLAATLVRAADAAAAVGLVLLATSPGAHVGGARTGGLLAAGLTAPHLLGPLLARRLDAARDGRGVLALAFATYGVALGAAAVLLEGGAVVPAAALVVAAGTCGPLLTGGLSSRLHGVAAGDAGARRRAEGFDAITYGVAGSAGPAAVAALAALTSPLAALLALAGSAVAAAAVTLTLPNDAGARAPAEALTPAAALRAIAANGPLRRVAAATMLTALGGGALSVVAVLLAVELGSSAGSGATLVAAFGLGNLAGSLLVTAFPQRGDPERLALRWVAAIAAGFALCALAPSRPLAIAAFALAGAPNAPFIAAALAARSRHAPPGGRAQVFVWMAGAKVAMGAAGAAIAGAAACAGPRALLAGAAVIAFAATAGARLDRRLARVIARRAVVAGRRHPGPPRRANQDEPTTGGRGGRSVRNAPNAGATRHLRTLVADPSPDPRGPA
jgi:hypothetical protein